jgi:hypothetical protein
VYGANVCVFIASYSTTMFVMHMHVHIHRTIFFVGESVGDKRLAYTDSVTIV